ncbi:MAG: hypothetical protein R3B13_26655 [Polyangiaceae bacterium]
MPSSGGAFTYAPTHGPWAPTYNQPWAPPVRDDRDRASPEEDDRWDRPNLLEFHVGLGTPYGAFGVAYVRDVARYFGFVVGGGKGSEGPQAVAGVRARIPLSSVAISAELSWSGGPYRWDSCGVLCFRDSDVKQWDFAHWLNVSPALEYRSAGGFSTRFYLGVGGLLNDADQCYNTDHSDGCSGSDDLLFFLGVSLGAAL